MLIAPWRRSVATRTLLLGCLLPALEGCGGKKVAPALPPPDVVVASVVQRDTPIYSEWVATLDGFVNAQIQPHVAGYIVKQNYTEGSVVQKGDVLFEIDPRPFQAAIDAAKANVKVAEAGVELAQKEYARYAMLARVGAATKEDVETWTAKGDVAAADKLRAEAAVGRADLDLEFSRITADIGGRIGKAELTEGNLVNAGGSEPLLTTIVSTDPMRIYFNVDERSLQRYARSVNAAGKNVTELLAALKSAEIAFAFALEGESGFEHSGKLAFSDNRVDPQTGTIQLYGTVPNKDGFFVAGARVRVRLPTGKPSPALLVPETAILSDQDKQYVLIADKDNVVRRRDVTLGVLTDDGMRAVQPADKLAEGEKPEDWWVIVDNLQRVRLNYPIDPQRAVAPAGKSG